MTVHRLPINAWYGGQTVNVHFPDDWNVIAHLAPDSPPSGRRRCPSGSAKTVWTASHSGAGAWPEPTGDHRRRLHKADGGSGPAVPPQGAPSCWDPGHEVGIVVATGTHGPPGDSALRQKLGDVAWSHCQVHLRHDQRGLVQLGRDSRDSRYWSTLTLQRPTTSSGSAASTRRTAPGSAVARSSPSACSADGASSTSTTAIRANRAYDIDNDFRRELEEITDILRLDQRLSACRRPSGGRTHHHGRPPRVLP